MAESERVAPARAPRFTCQQFLGVLASQKPGLREKELLAIMSRLFPRHCESLPKIRSPLQQLYGRLRTKLRKQDDNGEAFYQACSVDAWADIAIRSEDSLHDADCQFGCDHELFPWLWGDGAVNEAKRRKYVLECNELRAQRAREQAALLDPLEASIPSYDKAPHQRWIREECVQFTLEQLKRKYQTEAGFDPTPHIKKILRTDGTPRHQALHPSCAPLGVCLLTFVCWCRCNQIEDHDSDADADSDGDAPRPPAVAARLGRECHGRDVA